jgi:hypothetical protein
MNKFFSLHKAFLYYLSKILFLAAFVCLSCNKEMVSSNASCLNCYSASDTGSYLYINVTISEKQPAVPIVIYREKFDPGKQMKIEKMDTVTKSTYTLFVAFGHYYSVSAEYVDGIDTIYAVDGGIFDFEKVNCDNPCYQVVGGIYDVKKKL